MSKIKDEPICSHCGYPEKWHGAGEDHLFDAVGGSLGFIDPAFSEPARRRAPFSVRALGIILLALGGWVIIIKAIH